MSTPVTTPVNSEDQPRLYLDRGARRKLRLRRYFLPDLWMIDVALDASDCDQIVEIGPLEGPAARQLLTLLLDTEVSISEIWEGPHIDFTSDACWLEAAEDEPGNADAPLT